MVPKTRIGSSSLPTRSLFYYLSSLSIPFLSSIIFSIFIYVCNSLNFYAYWYKKDTLRLTINFSNKLYKLSSITIVSESDTARELVAGMSNSLDEIIQPNKTSNWFFHPPAWVSFTIFMVSFTILLLGISAEYEHGIKHMFWRSVLFSVTGFAYLYFGPKLHPYTTFDSPKADGLQSISSFYKSALVAFLLSAIVYPSLSKILFGQ